MAGPRAPAHGSLSVAHKPALAPAPRRPRADASAFAALGLEERLVEALANEGYADPTPVQTQSIPIVLAGSDLVGCAQTGTGKTAAFVLPMLQRLAVPGGRPRALVLTPTRELALQIGERTGAYGRYLKFNHVVIYGGVNQRRQERELQRGADIVIATPGRLLDLMRQRLLSLAAIEILVLDEADTMLDMGFIHDIKRIVAEVPKQRQTLLFSATMPATIQALVRGMTNKPSSVAVDPQSTPAERVSQSVFFVGRQDKRQLLQEILEGDALGRVLVFTRTKHGANRLADQLSRSGIGAAAIHGNKSQSAREHALGSFKQGKTPVLVATDVAARGIDVQGVNLVVNFDLPNVPESYVHRIGRTGRAGADGRAVSFCDTEERSLLRGIERLIRRRIDVAEHALSRTTEQPRSEAPANGSKLNESRKPAGHYGSAPKDWGAQSRNQRRRQKPSRRDPSRFTRGS